MDNTLNVHLNPEQTIDFQNNMTIRARRIFQNGFDAFALLKQTDTTAILKMYPTRQSYDADRNNLMNSVYGDLLASESCIRLTFQDKPLAIPTSLAILITSQMTREMYRDKLTNCVLRMETMQPEIYHQYRMTGEEIVTNQALMDSIIDTCIENDDANLSDNDRMRNAIFDSLTAMCEE